MNVSSYVEGEYGLSDVYIGVPTVINGNGADRIIELALSKEELSPTSFSRYHLRLSTTSRCYH